MGRTVRRVPMDWDHPKDERGRYIPLFDQDYASKAAEWCAEFLAWEDGTHPSRAGMESICRYFWEYSNVPDEETYRQRIWIPEEAVGYQLYETTTEGTPISPVFDNLDDLCEYAAEHCTTFASFKATAAEWKQMIGEGLVSHQEGRMIFI